MINANELRIGNYVSDNFASDSFFAQVKKLDFTRCHYGNFHSCYSDLKPIPITEEWLLKLGFEIEWLLSDSKGYYVLINNKKIRIKFVHSLQNIYFYIEKKDIYICL